MKSEETKVLKKLIGMSKAIKDGALPSLVVALELEEMLPDLLELQNYVVALESDLDTAHQELDDAEFAYEELYHDYTMLDNEIDMMREEYEEED